MAKTQLADLLTHEAAPHLIQMAKDLFQNGFSKDEVITEIDAAIDALIIAELPAASVLAPPLVNVAVKFIVNWAASLFKKEARQLNLPGISA